MRAFAAIIPTYKLWTLTIKWEVVPYKSQISTHFILLRDKTALKYDCVSVIDASVPSAKSENTGRGEGVRWGEISETLRWRRVFHGRLLSVSQRLFKSVFLCEPDCWKTDRQRDSRKERKERKGQSEGPWHFRGSIKNCSCCTRTEHYIITCMQ